MVVRDVGGPSVPQPIPPDEGEAPKTKKSARSERAMSPESVRTGQPNARVSMPRGAVGNKPETTSEIPQRGVGSVIKQSATSAVNAVEVALSKMTVEERAAVGAAIGDAIHGMDAEQKLTVIRGALQTIASHHPEAADKVLKVLEPYFSAPQEYVGDMRQAVNRNPLGYVDSIVRPAGE